MSRSDILGWPVSNEQKLGLIRQIAGEQVTPASGPAKIVKRRKRRAIRAEAGGLPPPRSQLWADLKRLAPKKAATLSYTQASTEQLEPMVEESEMTKQAWSTDAKPPPPLASAAI